MTHEEVINESKECAMRISAKMGLYGGDEKPYLEQAFSEGYDLAKSESPWISVEERMPEENGCLCAFVMGFVESKDVFTLHENGEVLVNNTINGEWDVFASDDSPVTHWMPIPPLKEKE